MSESHFQSMPTSIKLSFDQAYVDFVKSCESSEKFASWLATTNISADTRSFLNVNSNSEGQNGKVKFGTCDLMCWKTYELLSQSTRDNTLGTVVQTIQKVKSHICTPILNVEVQKLSSKDGSQSVKIASPLKTITRATLANDDIPRILRQNGPSSINAIVGCLIASLSDSADVEAEPLFEFVLDVLQGRGEDGKPCILNNKLAFKPDAWDRWSLMERKTMRPGQDHHLPPRWGNSYVSSIPEKRRVYTSMISRPFKETEIIHEAGLKPLKLLLAGPTSEHNHEFLHIQKPSQQSLGPPITTSVSTTEKPQLNARGMKRKRSTDAPDNKSEYFTSKLVDLAEVTPTSIAASLDSLKPTSNAPGAYGFAPGPTPSRLPCGSRTHTLNVDSELRQTQDIAYQYSLQNSEILCLTNKRALIRHRIEYISTHRQADKNAAFSSSQTRQGRLAKPPQGTGPYSLPFSSRKVLSTESWMILEQAGNSLTFPTGTSLFRISDEQLAITYPQKPGMLRVPDEMNSMATLRFMGFSNQIAHRLWQGKESYQGLVGAWVAPEDFVFDLPLGGSKLPVKLRLMSGQTLFEALTATIQNNNMPMTYDVRDKLLQKSVDSITRHLADRNWVYHIGIGAIMPVHGHGCWVKDYINMVESGGPCPQNEPVGAVIPPLPPIYPSDPLSVAKKYMNLIQSERTPCFGKEELGLSDYVMRMLFLPKNEKDATRCYLHRYPYMPPAYTLASFYGFLENVDRQVLELPQNSLKAARDQNLPANKRWIQRLDKAGISPLEFQLALASPRASPRMTWPTISLADRSIQAEISHKVIPRKNLRILEAAGEKVTVQNGFYFVSRNNHSMPLVPEYLDSPATLIYCFPFNWDIAMFLWRRFIDGELASRPLYRGSILKTARNYVKSCPDARRDTEDWKINMGRMGLRDEWQEMFLSDEYKYLMFRKGLKYCVFAVMKERYDYLETFDLFVDKVATQDFPPFCLQHQDCFSAFKKTPRVSTKSANSESTQADGSDTGITLLDDGLAGDARIRMSATAAGRPPEVATPPI